MKILSLFLLGVFCLTSHVGGVNAQTAVSISQIIPTSSSSPAGESVAKAFDGSPNSKYLNFDKYNTGATVELTTARIVRSITLTTANDSNERDPYNYILYGSSDAISGPWTTVASGLTGLSTNRWASNTVSFNNNTSYKYYKIIFPTVRNETYANSMQIGEIRMMYDPAYVPVVTIEKTVAQESQMLSNRSRQAASNQLYINQIGSYNTIDVVQSGIYNLADITINQGDNNYIGLDQNGLKNYSHISINGNNNAITTYQSNSGAAGVIGHYSSQSIVGSTNTSTVSQIGDGEKQSFISINGSSNNVTNNQFGVGSKYSDIKTTGNGHTISLDQKDGGNHAARIDVTNAGGASNINVIQQGNTNQVYSIQQSCATVGGCNVTLTQQ